MDVEVIINGELPSCSRCDRTVALLARLTTPDGSLDLHLCWTCDTGPTAGGRLLAAMTLPNDIRPADLFKEFALDWVSTGLDAQGWQYVRRDDPQH
ncbi:hypothetical protein ABTZ03_42250 [Kitasatospora sp. NPDC096077]|uniref:hypothetical protein n=1 Tax=Kitasatospora sp. NPDC096077 TaxID=3155544 RepID=UPI00332C9100